MTNEQDAASGNRRRRSPSKPYPAIPFEKILVLPRAISEYGVEGQMRRITLLDQMEISASSSQTREMFSASIKYGLSRGSYNAEFVTLTEQGVSVVESSKNPTPKGRELEFNLAIARFDPFKNLYDRLKNKRLPTEAVLRDELGRVGVPENDRDKAGRTFLKNARYLGLVKELSGADHVVPIEQVIEELQATKGQVANDASPSSTNEQPSKQVVTEPPTNVSVNEPPVHIDIQIHIDSTASPEQIDQIFASMARHLYGRE